MTAAKQRTQELDARVAREIARQDTFSTYGNDRDSVRLALACMEDELRETLQAFQAEKRPIEGRTWTQTQAELVQTLAVGLRLLRDIDSPPTFGLPAGCRAPDATCPRLTDCNRASCCQWETWAAVNPPRPGTI